MGRGGKGGVIFGGHCVLNTTACTQCRPKTFTHLYDTLRDFIDLRGFNRAVRRFPLQDAAKVVLLAAALVCTMSAQQDTADSTHETAPVNTLPDLTPAPAPGVKLLNLPNQKRLFGVIPNYRADNLQEQYVPLTTAEKYKIAKSDSFDWPNYVLLIGYAAQSQMADGGFKHGAAAGFGKFYARSVGDQVIGSYVTEAVLPGLLHEDPRFFRVGKGTFGNRAFHAIASVVITRKDDGRMCFNTPEIAGNAGVIAVTTLYYPDARSAGAGLERLGMAVGNDVVSNLITEFWPDVKRHLPFRKKQ